MYERATCIHIWMVHDDFIIFLAYPFFFVNTLAHLDGPHTVFIIGSGFNYSFRICGGLFKGHARRTRSMSVTQSYILIFLHYAVMPLVVQCQETTDYSKLELKLACRVNKERFQAQCAVDGSPWSTCVLFSTRKCPQRLVKRMFLSLIGSARIALNEYSAEAHTLLIAVIDDDGLTYNHTIQFRGATHPGMFGYIFVLGLYSTWIIITLMIVH